MEKGRQEPVSALQVKHLYLYNPDFSIYINILQKLSLHTCSYSPKSSERLGRPSQSVFYFSAGEQFRKE